ncbi:hypothetical protein D3C73_1353850 [compost metagenome]
MLRRIYRDGVARVDARAFHMLHNARNDYGLAVADCVDFDFLAQHVAVDQNRMLRINLDRFFHVAQ